MNTFAAMDGCERRLRVFGLRWQAKRDGACHDNLTLRQRVQAVLAPHDQLATR